MQPGISCLGHSLYSEVYIDSQYWQDSGASWVHPFVSKLVNQYITMNVYKAWPIFKTLNVIIKEKNSSIRNSWPRFFCRTRCFVKVSFLLFKEIVQPLEPPDHSMNPYLVEIQVTNIFRLHWGFHTVNQTKKALKTYGKHEKAINSIATIS